MEEGLYYSRPHIENFRNLLNNDASLVAARRESLQSSLQI